VLKAWVKIDIADSGREIEADDLPYVFCAFKLQQHDNVTGLGLGLYIARRILELHAGTLGVSSKHRRQRRGLRFGCPCGTLG
jgi:K+-sensing histidine kinase KdpD